MSRLNLKITHFFTFSLLLLLNFQIAHSFPFSLHEFNIDSYRYVSTENNFYYSNSKNNYVLPHTITPKEYYLKIIPNFRDKSFIFSGQITIKLLVIKDTDKIVLNSIDLNFNKTAVKIENINGTGTVLGNITVKNVETNATFEQVTISSEQQLKVNNLYSLTIKYTGFILEGMSGFYRSWYYNNGSIRWIGTTQMEAPYARTVFPCFDEPRFKTPFTIQIARSRNLKTVSNMPLDRTLESDPSIGDRVWDVYKKSPSMSTYLVAFCIFDFEYVKNEDVTVWMQPNAVDQAYYILNKVKGILNILKNFTAIDYSIKKMELVAVPDFSAGAMENWGLTTYREKYLLYKPNISTATDMQNVLSVVAHEMSHQWFGNLVTPVWWDYLWLNEAFATFFEYYIPSIMEPSWRMMEQFVVRELQYALSEDDGVGHPLNANVTTSTEAEANFDVYEYSKGGSIVRMMQHFTGENNFKTGIQEYLRNGVDQNAGVVTPQNLWNAFNKTLPSKVLPDGVKIYDIMKRWTDQRGFPLITINRNYANKTLSISQKEFLKMDNVENSTLQWWVPLTYTDSKKLDFSVYRTDLWLRPNEVKEIKLNTDDWVLFNIQQTGYYRVNYDTRNWNLLIDQLVKNHKVIHPINRAQIIDDSFALAEAGIISYDVPFKVSQYLSLERDYIPWFSAARAFHNLIHKFYFSSTGSHLKEFVQKLIRPIYKSITEMKSEQMSHIDKLTIGYILSFACNINLNDCEKNLASTFNNWNSKTTDSNLLPETKEAVLCTGVKLGTEQSWNNVWTYYNYSKISSEKFSILRSMGCSMNSAVLTKYLSMLTETKEPPLDIRKQDYRFVFSSVASRPLNTGTAIKFLTENYKVLQNVTSTVKSMFGYLGSAIVKQEDYNTLQQFYANNKENLGVLNGTVYNTLLDVKDQINWIKKYNSSIEQSLYDQTTTSVPSTTVISTTLPNNFTNTTVRPTSSSSGNLNQFFSYLLILVVILTCSNAV